MSAKYPNTLYNRVKFLKKRIDYKGMVKLGQLVRNAYILERNLLPSKINLTLLDKNKKPIVRSFAVYPENFKSVMDTVIHKFTSSYKPKRKRLSSKVPVFKTNKSLR